MLFWIKCNLKTLIDEHGKTDLTRHIQLDTDRPIWDHFFTVAPLVIIGTKEGTHFNLAPKHMATPLGYDNYFGFVCTPRHRTYHNIKESKVFSVCFPTPEQIVTASLSASTRSREGKLILDSLDIFPAESIDAPLVSGCYLYFECRLHKIVDGFGKNSLISGRIVRASVSEIALRVSEREDEEIFNTQPLLAYLAYGRFASIDHSFAFPFPKYFKI